MISVISRASRVGDWRPGEERGVRSASKTMRERCVPHPSKFRSLEVESCARIPCRVACGLLLASMGRGKGRLAAPTS
eukprot:11957647-Prorocentrum_lima.AAC.1